MLFCVDVNIPVIAWDVKNIGTTITNAGIPDEFQRLICSEIQKR